MADGAVKGAGVEADVDGVQVANVVDALGLGGRGVIGVVVLSLWMVLMTAIYFHTWFEKVSLPPLLMETMRISADGSTADGTSRRSLRALHDLHPAQVDTRMEKHRWTAWHIDAMGRVTDKRSKRARTG